jgi:hypothetical protein
MGEPAPAQRPTPSSWRRWALRAGVVVGFATTAWLLGSVAASAAPSDSALPGLDSLAGPDYSLSGLDSVAPAVAGELLESAGEIADDVADSAVLAAIAGTDDDSGAPETDPTLDDAANPSDAAAPSSGAADGVREADPATGPTQPVGDIVSTARKVVATTVARTSRAASAIVAQAEPVLDQAGRLAPAADALNKPVRSLVSSVNDVIDGARAAVVPVSVTEPAPVASVLHSAIAGIADPTGTSAAEISDAPAETSAVTSAVGSGRDLLPVAGGAERAASRDDAALGPMPSAGEVPARGANGVIQGSGDADAASAPVGSGPAMNQAPEAGSLTAPAPARPAQQPPAPAVAPAASSAAGSTANGGHDCAARLDAAIAPTHDASFMVRASMWFAPMDRAGEPGFSPG